MYSVYKRTENNSLPLWHFYFFYCFGEWTLWVYNINRYKFSYNLKHLFFVACFFCSSSFLMQYLHNFLCIFGWNLILRNLWFFFFLIHGCECNPLQVNTKDRYEHIFAFVLVETTTMRPMKKRRPINWKKLNLNSRKKNCQTLFKSLLIEMVELF